MGDDAAKAETFAGLAGVAGHLRGRVGRSLRLRAAPEIEFRNDASVAHAARIETLLEQLQREREAKEEDAESSDPTTGAASPDASTE